MPCPDDPDDARTRVAAIEAQLLVEDPDIVAASYEVDVGLLRWSLGMTPLERLRTCTRNARALARLQKLRHDDPGTPCGS